MDGGGGGDGMMRDSILDRLTSSASSLGSSTASFIATLTASDATGGGGGGSVLSQADEPPAVQVCRRLGAAGSVAADRLVAAALPTATSLQLGCSRCVYGMNWGVSAVLSRPHEYEDEGLAAHELLDLNSICSAELRVVGLATQVLIEMALEEVRNNNIAT